MGVNRRSFFGLFGAAAAAAPSVIARSEEVRPKPEPVKVPPGHAVCSTDNPIGLYYTTSEFPDEGPKSK